MPYLVSTGFQIIVLGKNFFTLSVISFLYCLEGSSIHEYHIMRCTMQGGWWEFLYENVMIYTCIYPRRDSQAEFIKVAG